jgi:hypothetical protein
VKERLLSKAAVVVLLLAGAAANTSAFFDWPPVFAWVGLLIVGCGLAAMVPGAKGLRHHPPLKDPEHEAKHGAQQGVGPDER